MAHSIEVSRTDQLLRMLPAATIAGMIALALTIVLGFETPNTPLYVLSVVLVLSAPVGVLLHLAFSHRLTRDEKRAWAKALTRPHSARAFSAYVGSPDRRAALARLRERDDESELINDV